MLTLRQPSVVQSRVGKALAVDQPVGGARFNPRHLAESITHFHTELVPIPGSEVKEPHSGVPKARQLGDEA